ncbi:MAG: oligosaccharide flippase family protein [Prevotella sp.]|nr:oligosaccharide flippase family protein [Prevotella sp.]
MKSNNSYRNIFKATSMFAGVQGFNILLNLLRTKLVAVYLGPAGVGLNAIYNETKELLHETTNCGMDQSGVREISIHYEKWLETKDREGLDNSLKLTRSLVVTLAIVGTILSVLLAYPLSMLTFSDAAHTWDFVCLAPAVGMSTLICGEMMVLKATRQIKKIAWLSTLTIIVGILTNIPLYYMWGLKGIIPAILFFLVVQLIIVCRYSFAHYPFEINLNRTFLKTGRPILILGASFVAQGFVAHGARLLIQAYINTHGTVVDVGYYNAVLGITSMFFGLFASSIAADFFPRLSGIFSNEGERRTVVIRQINVMQILTSPALVAFMIAANIMVPLLLSNEFVPMIPILEVALLTGLVKTIATPLQYLPLAAGDAKLYFFAELIAYAFMVPIYVLCYSQWGLQGIGYGICLFNIIDLLWAMLYCKVKYNITPNMSNIIFFTLQTLMIAMAFYITRSMGGLMFYIGSTALVAVSCLTSLLTFQKIRRRDEE